MKGYALSAAVMALIALAGTLTWMQSRNAALRVDLGAARLSLASAKVALAQANETARVHRIYLDQQAAQEKEWAALNRDLYSMEGRNAPLSSLLSATVERLYARP